MEEHKPKLLKTWHKIFLILILLSFLGLKLWQMHATTGNVVLKDQVLNIEIAKTLHQQYQGLGGRDTLAPYDGMLFLFDFPGKQGIVMRDMVFPIDIVWLKEGVVVDIAPNVPIEPDATEAQLKRYYPRADATAVLELPAGWAEKHQLQLGDRLRLLEE